MAEERNRRKAFRFTDIQRLAIKIGDEMMQNLRTNVAAFKERRATAEKQEEDKLTIKGAIRSAVDNYCAHSWPDDVELPEHCPECEKIVNEVIHNLAKLF